MAKGIRARLVGREGNPMQEKITVKQLRSFGLLVGGIFTLIGLWPTVFRGQDPRLWAVVLAGVLVIPAVVYPRSLTLVYQGWMMVGEGLGWVNTRIILGILFYGLFTPIGFIMRLRERDPMNRKFVPHASTYRIVRKPRQASHMVRQY